MRYSHGHLVIFISSTGDLADYRDAVEEALKDIELDGRRFESWPSSPRPPIEKCLKEVRASDALVLILGDRYGSATPGALSVTHLEYREAIGSEPPKPVFPFVLPSVGREPRQEQFVKEVARSHYRTNAQIASPNDLAAEVRRSVLAEFARCFRDVWLKPRKKGLPEISNVALLEKELPNEIERALPFLNDLYTRGSDVALRELRKPIEERFGESTDLMGFVHMATTNLAMQNYEIPDSELDEAIAFWSRDDVSRRTAAVARYYNQGNALGAVGKHKEAIAKYELAIAEEPGMAEAWKNLGTVHEALDAMDDAERCYREALVRDPRLFEAQLALAQLLLRENRDPQEALEVLDRINVGRIPSVHQASVMAWRALANQNLGNHGKAIALAEQAIKMNPSDSWSWRWGGRVHALAWRDDKKYVGASVRFFQRLTTRLPGDAQAWSELGQLLWLESDDSPGDELDAACTAFEKALSLGVEATAAFFDRFGHALMARGEHERAEQVHRRAYELDEKTAYCLGVCLITQGKYEEALEYVLLDAQRIHRDSRSWFQVALCCANLGRTTEAEMAYRRAIHDDPNYPHAWYNLGGLYWNLGEFGRAIRIWRKALDKFPQFERAEEVREVLAQHGNE